MTDPETLATLWATLVAADRQAKTGPVSDRRMLAAYRDGLLVAYSLVLPATTYEILEHLAREQAE